MNCGAEAFFIFGGHGYSVVDTKILQSVLRVILYKARMADQQQMLMVVHRRRLRVGSQYINKLQASRSQPNLKKLMPPPINRSNPT